MSDTLHVATKTMSILKFAIYLVLLLQPNDGTQRQRTRRVTSSTKAPTPTTSVEPRLITQRHACVEFLSDDISYFRLNVTLTSSAVISDSDEAMLVQSSVNNTWHYLESLYDFYPKGELVVEFTLQYQTPPNGNCLFFFNETTYDVTAIAEPTDLMKLSLYTNQTTMTSLASTFTRDVTTTHQSVTVSQSNITNNTSPSFLNMSMFLCPCKCTIAISEENYAKMMATMLKNLRIPKFQTSLSKRKLSSAPDNRISSKGIGVVGAFVMVVVFGIIVIGDVKLFLQNAKTAYVNIRTCYAN